MRVTAKGQLAIPKHLRDQLETIERLGFVHSTP